MNDFEGTNLAGEGIVNCPYVLSGACRLVTVRVTTDFSGPDILNDRSGWLDSILHKYAEVFYARKVSNTFSRKEHSRVYWKWKIERMPSISWEITMSK